MQRSETWQHALSFVEMLTVDVRLGILAEQILTLVILELVAELEYGGPASGRVVHLSRSSLCKAIGKQQPFPLRQLESSLRQLSSASVELQRGSERFRTSLVERFECKKQDNDVELAIVLSDRVIFTLRETQQPPSCRNCLDRRSIS